jgi:hypothetical protein
VSENTDSVRHFYSPTLGRTLCGEQGKSVVPGQNHLDLDDVTCEGCLAWPTETGQIGGEK